MHVAIFGRTNRRVCRIVDHRAHRYGRIRIRRVLFDYVSHGLLLHLELLRACTVGTTIVAVVVELVVRYTLVFVAAYKAIFVLSVCKLGRPANILVQVWVTSRMLHVLLILLLLWGWLTTLEEVILHGSPSTLAHG